MADLPIRVERNNGEVTVGFTPPEHTKFVPFETDAPILTDKRSVASFRTTVGYLARMSCIHGPVECKNGPMFDTRPMSRETVLLGAKLICLHETCPLDVPPPDDRGPDGGDREPRTPPPAPPSFSAELEADLSPESLEAFYEPYRQYDDDRIPVFD